MLRRTVHVKGGSTAGDVDIDDLRLKANMLRAFHVLPDEVDKLPYKLIKVMSIISEEEARDNG